MYKKGINMDNELARGLSASEERIQYDAQVKKVLSQKVILAWILRRTVEGFGNLTADEIAKCIEGTPQVACIPVNPGETNKEQIALNAESETEDPLLQMLNTLLSPKLDVKEKKHILEDKFDIGMQGQTGKEVELMCNLSGYVEEIGIKKGMAQGMAQGMAKEKRERIIRMLGKKKYSCEEIADLFEISVGEVAEIEKEALVFV